MDQDTDLNLDFVTMICRSRNRTDLRCTMESKLHLNGNESLLYIDVLFSRLKGEEKIIDSSLLNQKSKELNNFRQRCNCNKIHVPGSDSKVESNMIFFRCYSCHKCAKMASENEGCNELGGSVLSAFQVGEESIERLSSFQLISNLTLRSIIFTKEILKAGSLVLKDCEFYKFRNTVGVMCECVKEGKSTKNVRNNGKLLCCCRDLSISSRGHRHKRSASIQHKDNHDDLQQAAMKTRSSTALLTTTTFEREGDKILETLDYSNETEFQIFFNNLLLKRKLQIEAQWAYLCLVFISLLMLFSIWCLRGFYSRNTNKRLITHSDEDHFLTVKEVLYMKAAYLPMFNHQGALEEVLVHDCGTNPEPPPGHI